MSTRPELSVVIPVFDVAKWLPECLDSICAQTFTEWEAILIDDGSRDFSGVICDNFSRRDSRFKVIHQENKGVSAARNRGIEAATGELLAFIDPDDFLNECYFSELVSEMQRVDADVSVCAYHYADENGGQSPIYEFIGRLDAAAKRAPDHAEMLNNEAVIKGVYNNTFSCVSWGKVFKRELWGDARFPVGVDLGEDMMTVPGVIIKANRAVCAPKAIYYYRLRKKSLLHGTVSEERYLKDLAASSAMLEQLCEHSPENRDKFQFLKLQYDVGCLVNYLKTNPEKARGRSKLHILAQGITDSGSADVLTSLLEKLVVEHERY